MVCKENPTYQRENENFCFLRKIVNLWKLCGFGNYLTSESKIFEKFVKLHKKWQLKVKQQKLNWKIDSREQKITALQVKTYKIIL